MSHSLTHQIIFLSTAIICPHILPKVQVYLVTRLQMKWRAWQVSPANLITVHWPPEWSHSYSPNYTHRMSTTRTHITTMTQKVTFQMMNWVQKQQQMQEKVYMIESVGRTTPPSIHLGNSHIISTIGLVVSILCTTSKLMLPPVELHMTVQLNKATWSGKIFVNWISF